MEEKITIWDVVEFFQELFGRWFKTPAVTLS